MRIDHKKFLELCEQNQYKLLKNQFSTKAMIFILSTYVVVFYMKENY